MLPICSHARTRLPSLLGSAAGALSLPGGSLALALPRTSLTLPGSRARYRTPTILKRDILKATTPIAKRLDASKVWNTPKERRAKNGKPPVRGDKTRINITSDHLCDDITAFLGDDLLRHQGCDLIDMYPGAGVWSTKLHDVLQPRSHILLEPEHELYTPFLQPLLDRPGVRLVPKAGIVWTDLNHILSSEFLPHQTPRPWAPDIPPTRNDTLLVTINLANAPPRRFLSFESIASLVLFQLLSSMRAGSIFQRYGLVRMLVWTTPEDAGRLLPRVIQTRNRASIDAELNTEWVRQVAGINNSLDPDTLFTYTRDLNIDTQGMAQVIARMRAAGLVTPPGRETDMLRDVRAMGDDVPTAADQPPVWRFSDEEERLRLIAAHDAGKLKRNPVQARRYRNLINYHQWKIDRAQICFDIDMERRAVIDLYRAGSPDAPAAEAAWNEALEGRDRKLREMYVLYRDNLHVFTQDPPVLMWDRRPYEPLLARADEFFPNVPLALLDIQPHATHPLLRDMGRHSTHAGDYFELLLRCLQQNGTQGPSKALEVVAPGCSEALIPRCESLRDSDLGGSPLRGYGEIACRTMNERQMMDLLQAWMDWPLKPSYAHLVGRLTDTEEADDDE